jgi:hypothetical protein
VVLKAYQRQWTPRFLAAVKRTQSFLHAVGYPCPEPLEVDVLVGRARVHAESVLPDPGVGAATSASRDAMAAGLAELIGHCADRSEPALTEHPLRRPLTGVFPQPHSPIFDFEATRAGAEWIEAIAVRARQIVDADTSPPVIAHTDWSLRNIRVEGTGVSAVYDWDSLALVPEAEAVALAAATWSKTGEPADPTPTLDDVEQFVARYEHCRGRLFTVVQHRALRAAVVGTLAYVARCEHAIDPGQQRWTTTRPRLRELADTLL